MKKIIILGIILIALFLVGCAEVTCNKPYIKVGTSCCLDQNDNNVCDKDEVKEEVSESSVEEPTKEAEPIEEDVIEEQPTCINECSQPACNELYYVDCLVEADGCKDKQAKEKIKGKCGVECLEDSDCSNDETCSSNKCEEKSDFQKALEETQKAMEEYQEKTDKLNECTKVCAGEDYKIPAVKDQWYLVCYEIYYNLGMEELDKQIAKCKE